MCLGDIWDTAERQSFGTAYFVNVYSEPMFLMTSMDGEGDSFWEMLTKPFIPFEAPLWGLVIIVIVATSVSMVLFEFHRNESDFEDKDLKNCFFKSLYLAMSSFVNAGVAFNAVTVSGRLMSVGYGLFILICIASFTAETATVLISKAVSTKFENIEDVLKGREKICYAGGMRAMLEAKHPAVRQLGVVFDNFQTEAIVELLNNGTCSYALIGELWMQEAWAAGQHCHLQFVGSSVLEFPTGYWVSQEFQRLLGWGVALKRSEGLWSEMQRKFAGDSHCSDERRRRLQASQDDDASDGRQSPRLLKTAGGAAAAKMGAGDSQHLGIEHMIGVILIMAFIFVMATLIRCFELFVCPEPEDKEVEHIIGGQLASVRAIANKLTHKDDAATAKTVAEISTSLAEIKDLIVTNSNSQLREQQELEDLIVRTVGSSRPSKHESNIDSSGDWQQPRRLSEMTSPSRSQGELSVGLGLGPMRPSQRSESHQPPDTTNPTRSPGGLHSNVSHVRILETI